MASPNATPTQSRFLWTVAPPVIRGLGRTLFSLRVERESVIPQPPFVVAANHYSHFDPPTLAASLDIPMRYLAVDDLFGANRLLDWLILGFGAIATPRDKVPITAIRTSLKALDSGEVVAVFPEATRVTHWGTLPPKRGAAWLAIRAGVPLVPVAVLGTGRVFGLENKLRRAPIRVVVGTPIDSSDLDADQLTEKWASWMTETVGRYPDAEISGPARAFHEE